MDYIDSFYDVLHTFGDKYTVEDIDEFILKIAETQEKSHPKKGGTDENVFNVDKIECRQNLGLLGLRAKSYQDRCTLCHNLTDKQELANFA